MTKKIIVVDDEQAICESVSHALAGENVLVSIALDGKEAIKKVCSEHFDLAFIDLFMPNMSGRQVCEEISKNSDLNEMKLILMSTARISSGGLESLKEINICGCIHKPFSSERIVQEVRKHLG